MGLVIFLSIYLSIYQIDNYISDSNHYLYASLYLYQYTILTSLLFFIFNIGSGKALRGRDGSMDEAVDGNFI
jgi:hypothetical protein